jgi:hypothetical protein
MPKEYVKLSPLEVQPALAKALSDYSKTTGVPMAQIRREILYKFFEPYINDPTLARRLRVVQGARVAEAAAEMSPGYQDGEAA